WGISSIDKVLTYVGSGLLMLIGFYMVIEKWLNREEELCNFNLAGWGMLVLGFSVSIDSLSVGVSLGMLGHINSFITLTIGGTAAIMMASGLYFGSRIGHFIGEESQVFGGLGLITLGLHFAGII
ncbi:MAG: manganese efflux pump, partial [Halanaerobiales bacterium]